MITQQGSQEATWSVNKPQSVLTLKRSTTEMIGMDGYNIGRFSAKGQLQQLNTKSLTFLSLSSTCYSSHPARLIYSPLKTNNKQVRLSLLSPSGHDEAWNIGSRHRLHEDC
jgi:hypothetical protein